MQPSSPSSHSSSSRDRSRVDWPIWAGQVGLFALTYVGAGLLGLDLTHYHDNVTLIWPPTGLSLAVLILYGIRLWPGVFVGALLVNLSNATGWEASFGIAVGNTLEAFVGATLLMRLADFQSAMERQRDWMTFVLVGVLGCTTLSATIGTASLLVTGGLEAAAYWRVWLIWWLGDVGGALVVTPALLMMVRGTPAWKSLFRRAEFWLVLTTLFATSFLTFFGPDLGRQGFALTITAFPVLTWAGTRLGPRGAMLISFFAISIATTATGFGSGPFVLGTPTEAMLLLWSYSILIGVVAFTLAAVVEQRNAAERRYRAEELDRLRSEQQQMLLLERHRLTRELHDGVGGQLVSVLSMVERGHAAPSEVAEALRRALDEIRIVVDSLDSHTPELGVSLEKLRARLEPLLRRNGIELRWDVDGLRGLTEFPPEATLHLLRIIQEAVTNTLRHSRASGIEIRITSSDGPTQKRLQMNIVDDGCGLGQVPSAGGRGMRNMKFRAEQLGADLRIESTGSGTRIELTIPIAGEAGLAVDADTRGLS